jgi:hypothetical protein
MVGYVVLLPVFYSLAKSSFYSLGTNNAKGIEPDSIKLLAETKKLKNDTIILKNNFYRIFSLKNTSRLLLSVQTFNN